jgi:HD-like signal output (HDOD) protein
MLLWLFGRMNALATAPVTTQPTDQTAMPAMPEAYPTWRAAAERLLARRADLVPALPNAAARALALLRRAPEDTDAATAALAADPALSAEVHRVAREFGTTHVGNPGALEGALAGLIPAWRTRAVLTAAILRVLRTDIAHLDQRIATAADRTLRHVLTSALAAERLAAVRDPAAGAAAFEAGLLHALGRAVALRAVAAVVPPQAHGPHGRAHVVASLVEGLQFECARRVLATWPLPTDVLAAARGVLETNVDPVELPRASHLVRVVAHIDASARDRHARIGLREELLESLRALDIPLGRLAVVEAEVEAVRETVARLVGAL